MFSLLSNFKNKALFGREYTKRTYLKNPWVLLLTIIVILGYVSCFYSEDPIKSLKGHGYLWQGFVGILCYAGIFVAASLISDEKQKRFLLNLHVIVSVILAAATLLAAECGLKSLLFLTRTTMFMIIAARYRIFAVIFFS